MHDGPRPQTVQFAQFGGELFQGGRSDGRAVSTLLIRHDQTTAAELGKPLAYGTRAATQLTYEVCNKPCMPWFLAKQ